jgi:hypothetical protein
LQYAAPLPDPALPAEVSWFLAMTEQVTAVMPRIVDGAVELPDAPSLASLVEWSALDRLAA